ncbi:MAG TPA: hypothetical protein VM599_03685 [Thermoanaerobaculia bacterium]|nr:hypothetical protein [Thermoanaerobaculia bacterium]
MIERTPRTLILPCALLLALAAGCGSVLPGGRGPSTPPPAADRVVTGEVAWVDAGNQELEVQHRTGRLQARYDANTRVFYQGQEYRPENLEPGDVVRMEVVGSGYENVYVQRIEVTESVQTRDDRDERDDRYDPDDRYGDRYVSGDVDRVDTQRREIVIDTSRGDEVVRYDDRTRVVYRGDDYRPENLERGDQVRVEIADTRGAYAETIEVTRSVQERQGGDPRAGSGSYTGTVEWIDERRGEFGLRTDNRDILTVEIPFDARDSVRDEFARLDRGDFVRIEADPREPDRLTLVRFL